MSMSTAAARRHMQANRQVVAQRLQDMARSKTVLESKVRDIPSSWFVAGGFAAGLIVGGLPARVLAATIGALAGFSLRLLNTPLGPMAVGAMMARRGRGGDDGTRDAVGNPSARTP